MAISIKIEGLSELVGKLNTLAGGAESGLAQGLLQGGELVRGQAAADCPVDTGRLRSSIAVEGGGTSVTVGTNVEYGIYQEFGTYKMAPQPFLIPALFSQKDAVVEAVKAAVLAALA